jgi:hypothetical protein
MCAWWLMTRSAPASTAARAICFSYGITSAGVCTVPLCSDTLRKSQAARVRAISAFIASSVSASAPVNTVGGPPGVA